MGLHSAKRRRWRRRIATALLEDPHAELLERLRRFDPVMAGGLQRRLDDARARAWDRLSKGGTLP